MARILPKLVGHFIQIKKCPWDNIGVVAGISARGKILKQTNRHINIQSSSICNLGLKQNGNELAVEVELRVQVSGAVVRRRRE